MYFKLALGNVKKSIRGYGIYFLTLVFGICIFYAFNSITEQQGVLALNDRQSAMIDFLSTLIGGVSVFIAVVLGFLIVYASRYLIRRRKKEFGIYLTLGMSVGKVSRIVVYETLFVGLISLLIGLVGGLALSQALLYITALLFQVNMEMFTFIFSVPSLIKTILYFAIIFTVAMLFNVVSIARYQLINLINADKKNEAVKLRNLPLSVFFFILSLVLIGVSYGLLIDNGLREFDNQFALSTALVCLGTFLLFYSLAGFLLRAVQGCKKLYLRGLNMFTLRQINSKINTTFFSISLVCLTLFLAITSSCTGFAMCTTFTSNLEKTTLYDASLTSYYRSTNELEEGKSSAWVESAKADGHDMQIALSREVEGWDNLVKSAAQTTFYNSDITLSYLLDNSDYSLNNSLYLGNSSDPQIYMTTISDFNAQRSLAGLSPIDLADDEYLFWCDFEDLQGLYTAFLEQKGELTTFGTTLYPAQTTIETLTVQTSSSATESPGTIVVPDNFIDPDLPYAHSILNVMFTGSRGATDTDFQEALHGAYFNIDQDSEKSDWPVASYRTAVQVYEQSTGLSVVITYLAVYIGFVLLIASAAILALQQLSEAADNVVRYGFLEKLGVEQKMTNRALFVQIGIYFVFPLVVGLCHSFVALNVVANVVQILGHVNIVLPLAITLVIFLLIYSIYFLITYFASRAMIYQGAKG
jgi:putative ABC transport system permease protein